MSTPSVKQTAEAIFGQGSWEWVEYSLTQVSFDFSRASDAISASTLIEASHGNSDKFVQFVTDASKGAFPYRMHREWLAIEARFNMESWLEWFVQVIREIAIPAITRELYPAGSVYTLLVDRENEFRPETIAIIPDPSQMVVVCTYAESLQEMDNPDLIPVSQIADHVIPMFSQLPV